MEARLAIVIVNYNTGALLRCCLEALWPQLEPGFEVVVVDNASIDGSAEGLEQAYPELRLIRNSHNVGYARANNQALRLARAGYLLLLNPDVTLEPGALATAVAYMDAHPDLGILGPRILRPDGRLDPPARRSFKTPATYLYKALGLSRLLPRHPRFGHYYLSYLDELAITDVDAVVGAFLLIRRAVMERIGLLDERFFMYCEDEDWCWRAKQAGWRVVYHPGIVAHHRRGSSTALHPFRMAYHLHRSYFLYHRKNIAARYPAIINGAVYAGILLGFVVAVGRRAALRGLRLRRPPWKGLPGSERAVVAPGNRSPGEDPASGERAA
jgi:GT2 family glycosyltransferase